MLINAENHRTGKVGRDHGGVMSQVHPGVTELVKGLLSPAAVPFCNEAMAGSGMGSAWMGAW